MNRKETSYTLAKRKVLVTTNPTQLESSKTVAPFANYGHRNFEFEFEKLNFKIVQKCETLVLG